VTFAGDRGRGVSYTFRNSAEGRLIDKEGGRKREGSRLAILKSLYKLEEGFNWKNFWKMFPWN